MNLQPQELTDKILEVQLEEIRHILQLIKQHPQSVYELRRILADVESLDTEDFDFSTLSATENQVNEQSRFRVQVGGQYFYMTQEVAKNFAPERNDYVSTKL
jgi:hypothetical protein